jgi:hypothetical protein
LGVHLFGLAFMGIAGVFLVVGGVMARRQARRLATYRPVPAMVLSSEVVGSSDSDGRTYSPNIRFSYTVGGQTHEGDSPLPVGKMSSSGNWAQKIVDRFPAGMKTSAYVDPADASNAFLVRHVSFLPYIFVLFPMIHFAVGLGALLGDGDPPLCTTAQALLITALAWNAVGAACLFHYRSAGGQMTLPIQVVFILYGGAGLILLVAASHVAGEKPTLAPATRPVEVDVEKP